MQELAGPIALVILVVMVPYFTVWPSVRRHLTRTRGVPARAIVKSIATRAHRDDTTKTYDRELVLEVHREGEAPYEVSVRQPMPWLSGSGMLGSEYAVLVHPSRKNWVYVPAPKSPTL